MSPLDTALVNFIHQQVESPSYPLLIAMALVASSASDGHVCLPIDELAKLKRADIEALGLGVTIKDDNLPINQTEWIKALSAEERIASLIDTDSGIPNISGALLVMEEYERLYLPRFFDLEKRLLKQLQARCCLKQSIDFDLAYQRLNQLFGKSISDDVKSVSDDGDELNETPDWQKVAACIALLHAFSVISGGPGTGKTTTVIRLIALLVSQPNLNTESIALVAPTGKAAARLSESIAAKKHELALESAIADKIPTNASTIHRLLGISQRGLFQHHAGNKLNVDVIIVDEASMVDIALMVRLLEALPNHTKVILLGDKDQLSSVEAGSVLADLCQTQFINQMSSQGQSLLAHLMFGNAEQACGFFSEDENAISAVDGASPFANCIAELKRSYRFDANSGIGQLAYAVNDGDIQRSESVIQDVGFDDVELKAKPGAKEAEFELITQAAEHYSEYLSYLGDPLVCLQAFNRFRVLTAVKEGRFGSIELNKAIAKRLQQQGKINTSELYYAGLPIMIMQNNYQVNLFNGDIGIFMRMPNSHELRVVFDDGEGGYRDIAPALLPKWEPAFVMTVHKSQGSEFNQVAMVLPDRPSPLLTREMLYTGITRAKQAFTLYASQEELTACIESATKRYSGLSVYL